MNFKKYILSLACVTGIIFSGCKPLQIIENTRERTMPATFGGTTDSTNPAAISWRQYFDDRHLIKIIDSALANNLDLQMALQRVQASQSQVLFAQGMLKPVVAGGASAGLNKFGDYTMDGAGNKGTEIYRGKDIPRHLPDYFAGFQASWEVDIWGKLRNQKKAAIARYLSSVEGKNLVTTNLVAEIANSYYELLGLDQEFNIIQQTIKLQQNALEIVRAQKEAAVTTELAVKQFEAQLLNLNKMKLDVVQRRMETENRINFLAGRFPETVARDTTYFDRVTIVNVSPGIPSALLQHRPDIRQAELEVIAAKADVQSAKAAFYPSLNINGTLGFQSFKTGLLFSTPESIAYALIGSLTAPLINRSAIQAAFNRANALQLEALYNYQQNILNAYIEVYNQMFRIGILQQSYDVKLAEVNTVTKAIEISDELFKTGMASYLEVLIAQQNALQSKLDLVNIKRDRLMASVNIYKALGGGWR